MEFAELEMTDLDIQGAVTFFQAQLAEGLGGEMEDEVKVKLAEALTACGTVKMLLGDQPGAEEALGQARSLYTQLGDEDGELSAAGLLTDVTRIMDKVDSTSVTPIS
mmetsp:Transcript_74329/g.108991  ORF Transcript_74329/g.108991 Transcript_74329/m.108991 type:complete len:107 (-) Transcript_74329:289-609(-)